MPTYSIIGEYGDEFKIHVFAGCFKNNADNPALVDGNIEGRTIRGIMREDTLLFAENIDGGTAVFCLAPRDGLYVGKRLTLNHKMRLPPDIGILLEAIDPSEYRNASVVATVKKMR